MKKTPMPHWRRIIPIVVVLVTTQFSLSFSAFAQEQSVTGSIIDQNTGEALPGVNIVVKGTGPGTITDPNGNYSINVQRNDTLVFSFIGYLSEEIVIAGQSVVDIYLVPDMMALDEVVVVGYGTARRRDLTGSIATVSSETLKKIPMANAAEAIKGRMPGVNVITTDGSPDAEIVIRVRGGGSVTQDNSPLYVVDGFIVSSIRDIPPNDISSITVLKDAAATAIYGAQAANGVVLITTKSPVAGKTFVSYNGYVKLRTFPEERKYDVLNPYEFVMMQYEKAILKSEADLRDFERFFGKYEDIELYKHKKPTDWQDEVFGGNKISQSHNLSISGGTEKTKLSLSLNHNKDDGIMLNSGYQRSVLNFKLNHDIFKTLKFDGSIRMTDTRIDGAGTTGSSQIRVKNIVTARPVDGIAEELELDMTSEDTDNDYQQFLFNKLNPVEVIEQDWRQRNTFNYVLQGGLTWNPIEELTVKTTLSNSRTADENLRFYGPKTGESQKEGNGLPLGEVEKKQKNSFRWLNTVNYSFKNFGNHHLDLLLGQEAYSNGGSGSEVRAEDFRETMQPEEIFANMWLGTIESYSSYESTNQNRLSLFGRVNYKFKERYLVTATLRSDASSKFSKENRIGIFPAMAVGWKIDQEAFMANVVYINELKIRASYGQTGNDRIPANSTLFLFKGSTNNGPGMGTNAYQAYYQPDGSTLYNPDLIWETTINRNIGVDFMFFRRLSGSIDLYKNTTEDLLLASAISPISGFNTQWNNIGNTSNRGIELMLNGTIVERGDFMLRANFNFGFNKSKIEELDGTDERFFQTNWAGTDLRDRDDYYLAVGQTVGLIYGYVNDGMYTTDDFSSYDEASGEYTLNEGVIDNSNINGTTIRPGSMKLKDISGPEGVPDGEINSLDRKVIGSALPDATGGFSFEAIYKGFDASVLFNWSIGNDVYNTGKIDYNQTYRTTYGNMLSTMSSDKRFTYIDVDGSITGTAGGVVTDLDQLNQLNQGKTIWSGSNSFGQATPVLTDWAIEDGSFLRLSTITLGYTIPSDLTSKIGVSQFRIYATALNVWLWTKYSGYDPEVSTTRGGGYGALTPGLDFSSYPRSRSFTLGVNLTF